MDKDADDHARREHSNILIMTIHNKRVTLSASDDDGDDLDSPQGQLRRVPINSDNIARSNFFSDKSCL